MKQLSPTQLGILLFLKGDMEEVKYIAFGEDIQQLYAMRLITSHISGAGYILSQEGHKITDNALSSVNHMPSE